MDYEAADYRLRELGAVETARADATRSYFAKMAADRLAAQARPFRFEDLNGRPEPASWGPVYPKTASAAVEKWRKLERKRELTDEETRAYGAAVGDWIRTLNRPARSGPISLKCTVRNTCGTDNTAAGEAERYRIWIEVRLPAIRAARLAAAKLLEAA